MDNMIVWALFDSGNGCYKQAADKMEGIELYSIGLDIENKSDHFLSVNLADYSYLFGNDILIKELSKLPKPDLIIASPPCESWSVASAMKGGNASWKQEQGDSLFEPQTPLSRFTIREHKDYEKVQYKFERSLINRINGELCTFNTIKIIKAFKPKYYIIENPASSRMWEYIENVIGFDIPYENMTYYNNYGYELKKPTKFKSNLDLQLKRDNTHVGYSMPERMHGYNNRSNIPEKLILDIYKIVKEKFAAEVNRRS